MEGLIFLLFIGIISLAVTSTISMNKVKNQVYKLQRQVHDLSLRLEENIRSQENRVYEEVGDNSVDDVNVKATQPEELIEDVSFATSVEEATEVKDMSEVIETIEAGELVKTVAMKQDSSTLRQFKSVTGNTATQISDTKVSVDEALSQMTGSTQVEKAVVKTVSKPTSNLFTIESIISKLGIFLLLIGVGFIYKLAYDKGYVTPTLVVFLGFVFGLAVIAVGMRVRKKKREVLSQVLFGGGVAILYITTFAAYQGYGLIKGFLAFVILFGITFLAFFIALSVNSIAMSIIALLGGLITPFIVGIDVLGLYGTGLYILFIAIGSMAIYIFKRWRILQLTSIVGINLITLLLTSTGAFNAKETVEFSILLLAILVVFYGVEYMHYYLGRDYAKEIYLTVGIISILPVLTLFQVLSVLDISQVSWAIIFGIVSLVFFGLNYLLYKKREHSLVTDVLMGYIGLFTLIGIILYFGGEVRYIAILILGLIFTLIHVKSAYLLTRIIGLLIYLVGYSWALVDLIDQVLDENVEVVKILVRAVVMILITLIAWLQKDIIRKILGGFAFQIYLFIALMSMIITWTQYDIEPVVTMIIVFGLLMVFFIWLYKKFDILSIHAIVVMSMLPFVIKVITSGVALYEDEVMWLQTLMFILYGVEMYVISLSILKDDAKGLLFSLKTFGYIMLSSVVLVEIPVWSGHFGYGLVMFVCIVLLMDYYESEEDRLMKLLKLVFKMGFMAVFITYVLSLTGQSEMNILHFVFDLILVVGVWYFLKEFVKDERILYVVITLLYMLVVYQNLGIGDNGIVTLFWAAYGIISMAYFLFKGKRSLVYLALGVIVFVAIKFIIIDLSTIEMIWKIITSMAFGAALLVLSYVIQPLLDKYDSREDVVETLETEE